MLQVYFALRSYLVEYYSMACSDLERRADTLGHVSSDGGGGSVSTVPAPPVPALRLPGGDYTPRSKLTTIAITIG